MLGFLSICTVSSFFFFPIEYIRDCGISLCASSEYTNRLSQICLLRLECTSIETTFILFRFFPVYFFFSRWLFAFLLNEVHHRHRLELTYHKDKNWHRQSLASPSISSSFSFFLFFCFVSMSQSDSLRPIAQLKSISF